jgi:hypothetical protein
MRVRFDDSQWRVSHGGDLREVEIADITQREDTELFGWQRCDGAGRFLTPLALEQARKPTTRAKSIASANSLSASATKA